MERNRNVKTVDFMCYNEKIIREAVDEEKKRTIGHSGEPPSGNNSVSDPTAVQAVRNIDEISRVALPEEKGTVFRPERWLRVVNAMRNYCREKYGTDAMFTLTYEKKKKWQYITIELNIDQSTYHRRMERLRQFGLQAAAQEQLITVF